MTRTSFTPRSTKRPKPPTAAEQQRACDDWNTLHAIGTAIHVTQDDGSSKAAVTESRAWLLGGHTAVIMLSGVSGAYSLERVHPVK